MRTILPLAAAALAIALAGCGRAEPDASENLARQLEDAADQSTPEAAEVLENAADHVREEDIAAPPHAPPAQRALEAAGEAQVLPGTGPDGNLQNRQ